MSGNGGQWARWFFNIASPRPPYGLAHISIKKAEVKKTPSTKIELSCSKVARAQSLDELARFLFPGNRTHQKIFLVIFIELKYAPGRFLPRLEPLCPKHGLSPRVMETVRAKLRRMGLLEFVSRLSKAHGYREGWVASTRFRRALDRLAHINEEFWERNDAVQEQKDRDLLRYI